MRHGSGRGLSKPDDRLAIEAMKVDVVQDSLREEVTGVAREVVNLVAQLGGADVVLEVGEEEQAGLITGEVLQPVVMRADGVEGDRGGKQRSQVGEVLVRARSDDKGGNEGDFGGTVPVVECTEGVSAKEQVPTYLGRVLGAE